MVVNLSTILSGKVNCALSFSAGKLANRSYFVLLAALSIRAVKRTVTAICKSCYWKLM